MAAKQVDDYLQDGIYGTRLPKQTERDKFLGTLRERIILALTTGQVMTNKGITILEQEIQKHPKAKLMFNGKIDSKFLREEKKVANQYQIPYSIINNVEARTDIGAVLYYDYAIDKDEIFIHEANANTKNSKKKDSLLHKLGSILFS